MATSWGWIGPYIAVFVLAVLVSPLLAAVPLFTHTFVPSLRMNAAQAVRLAADGVCVLLLWLATRRARRELKANGKGQAFIRALLYPAACFFTVIAVHKVYEMHGLPVVG